MLVTREADYAVRCIVEVAKAGHTSAAQVARMQEISPTFLGKIIRSLAKAGILATRRGVGGGITLAKRPEEFTLLEVIEAVEGRLCIIECLRSSGGCPHEGECLAYPYLALAQERLRETLDVSFAEILARRDAPTEHIGDGGAAKLASAGTRPTDPAGNGHRGRTRAADVAARGGG